MNAKPIDELIQSCFQALKETNYKSEVFMRHEKHFILLKSFMKEKSKNLYSEIIGESFKLAFLETGKYPPSSYRFQIINSSVNLLNDVLNNIPLKRKRIDRKVYYFPGEIGNHIISFLKIYKENERPSDKTFFKHSRNLSYFAERMNQDNISLQSLDSEVVIRFTSSLKNSGYYTCCSLRLFLHHLYENKLTDINLSVLLREIKRKSQPEKLPSVYSSEEIREMERSINKTKGTGKRNYAVFLLASRLGLRSSDICFLQFGNIDWDHNLIRLQQYKTKENIELPLLSVIGEAIIDYIRHGRPKSDSKTIFLTGTSPYTPMSRGNVFAIINDIISKSEVEIKNRRHGPHSLRHSLASQLLEQETSLPVISGILGHTNSLSTMTYLNIDVKNLLECSLAVPMVKESFYIQKNGAFYE